jgi:hypothetical protein
VSAGRGKDRTLLDERDPRIAGRFRLNVLLGVTLYRGAYDTVIRGIAKNYPFAMKFSTT